MIRALASAATLVVAMIAGPGWALPEDSAQKLVIEADESTYEMSTGTAVFTGTVRIEQGTLRVTASRVTTTNHAGRLSRLVAEGDAEAPATLRQRINPGEPFATARAARIDYVITDGRLELSGDALLKHNDREISGQRIFWDIKEGRVHARSEQPGGVTGEWQPKQPATSD